MVLGNCIVAAAAFFLGSYGGIDWAQFALMIAGLALTIASGCIFNNWYDRSIDARMLRTQSRPTAQGRVWGPGVALEGLVLLAVGLALLSFEPLALAFAALGWIFYVLVYTPLKHISGHALWAGALAGATPPVVGYAAAAHHLDTIAALLFAFLFLWQVPHFLAIARYRFGEYAAAGVPLLVKMSESKEARARARAIFKGSLALLLLSCVALAATHFLY